MKTSLKNCVFCKIIKKEADAFQIFENKNSVASLDKFPISLGHSLVISKKHYKNLESLDTNTWIDILSSAKEVIKTLKKNLNVEDFNLINNIGSKAYQKVFHFHLHIIPKYQEDRGFIWENKVDENLESFNLLELSEKISCLKNKKNTKEE